MWPAAQRGTGLKKNGWVSESVEKSQVPPPFCTPPGPPRLQGPRHRVHRSLSCFCLTFITSFVPSFIPQPSLACANISVVAAIFYLTGDFSRPTCRWDAVHSHKRNSLYASTHRYRIKYLYNLRCADGCLFLLNTRARQAPASSRGSRAKPS